MKHSTLNPESGAYHLRNDLSADVVADGNDFQLSLSVHGNAPFPKIPA